MAVLRDGRRCGEDSPSLYSAPGIGRTACRTAWTNMRGSITLLRGLLTYAPGAAALHRRMTHTGGTDSARYCYAVWLRHLVAGFDNRVCRTHPRTVAELGPGDSLGIGIAALLSGADFYYGLDLLPLANAARNLAVLDDLVQLYRAQASIPEPSEFPGVRPTLSEYDFPSDLVRFDERRVQAIKESIEDPFRSSSLIRYVSPWSHADHVENGAIDLILSQAVLEHVDDLDGAYASMRKWLNASGWMSHQIDFRSHATAGDWNGHWTYDERLWRLMRGRRAYFINRRPYSDHVSILNRHDFRIVAEQKSRGPAIDRRRLSQSFQGLSDDDLTTDGVFIQCVPVEPARAEPCATGDHTGNVR